MVKVILVDNDDNEIGTEEKLAAHTNPRLHRAFSIFTFNSRGEVLLQKRADSKYHCPGLWANTCCSHPSPGEDTIDSAHKRLMQEMGFDTELERKFVFIYRAEFENGLIEHEFDHVFFGRYDENPLVNSDEVSEFRWVSIEKLIDDIEKTPEIYTPWLRIIIKEHGHHFMS